MQNFLEYFEHVYVINLPTRADRRKEMDIQLNKVGTSFANDRISLFQAVRPSDAGGFPSIGAHGCFMSHLGVLRDAIDKGFNRILILEDDLDFCHDFLKRSPAIVEALVDKSWALFYGGYELQKPLAKNTEEAVSIVPSIDPIQTTHFVAFNGSAIAKVVLYLEAMLFRLPGDPNGGPMHVDGAYSWFRKDNPEMITLIANDELGRQRASRTDIHDLRWYDRMPAVRDVVGLIRRYKSKLRS